VALRGKWVRAAALSGPLAILALVLILICTVGPLAHRPTATPVLSMAEVAAGVARRPAAWAGRTILVSGLVMGYATTRWAGTHWQAGEFWTPTPCDAPPCPPDMAGAFPPGTSFHLALAPDRPTRSDDWPFWVTYHPQPRPTALGAIVSALRRVPIIGNLIPVPQTPFTSPTQFTQWGVPRIYRLQLASRLPYGSCRQGVCDAAVMTDAAP